MREPFDRRQMKRMKTNERRKKSGEWANIGVSACGDNEQRTIRAHLLLAIERSFVPPILGQCGKHDTNE